MMLKASKIIAGYFEESLSWELMVKTVQKSFFLSRPAFFEDDDGVILTVAGTQHECTFTSVGGIKECRLLDDRIELDVRSSSKWWKHTPNYEEGELSRCPTFLILGLKLSFSDLEVDTRELHEILTKVFCGYSCYRDCRTTRKRRLNK